MSASARTPASGSARLFSAEKNLRNTAKREALHEALDLAGYLGLRGKVKHDEIKAGKSFKFAAEQFLREHPIITEGQRNARYVERHEKRVRNHLMPFFGSKIVYEITPGLLQEYRTHRREKTMQQYGNPPGAQLRASGNGLSSPDSKDSQPARLARLSCRYDRALSDEGYNLPSGLVLARGIQKSFMKRLGGAFSSPGASAINGSMNSSMTSCCSWPTPVFARTRRSGFKIAT